MHNFANPFMTKITEKIIDNLSHLARLEFSEEQKPVVRENLERILVFCEKLNEVNTDDVEPLIYMSNHKNQLRPDSVSASLDHDFAMKNAPNSDSDYIRVPKFIRK